MDRKHYRLYAASIAALLVAFFAAIGVWAAEIQIIDLVESRPAEGLLGAWVVGGTTITVDETTQIEGTDIALQAEHCVEVKYEAGESGNVANLLRAKARSYCETIMQHRALLNVFPPDLIGIWTIGDVNYTADATTEFDSAYSVGDCIEVRYGADTLRATKIDVRAIGDCQLKFEDLIEVRPSGDVTGTWTIGGVAVAVDAATVFDAPNDTYDVGYCVETTYLNDGFDNPATKIKAEPRGDCEAVTVDRAVIQSLPEGLLGEWQIGTNAYLADANTEFKDDRGPFDVGVCVDVTFGATSGIATKLEVRNPSDCYVKLEDLIELRPSGDVTGTWTIGGVEMAVDAATWFDGPDDTYDVGYCVEATYFNDLGANPAIKIKAEPRGDCENVVSKRARIDAFPADLLGTWVIDGMSFTGDSNTEFKDDRGPFDIGVCVEVRFGSVSMVAEKIEVRDDGDCLGPEAKLVGLVSARPDGTNIGDWTVGGVTATADANTTVEGEADALQVGYCVELKYAADGEATVATAIKAKDRDDCEALIKERGRVAALPADLLGTWLIDGEAYLVDSNSELKDDKGPFEVGVCVEVTYGNETAIATKVETREAIDCLGPEIKRVDFILDRPSTFITGTWDIGGVIVEVTETTEIAAPDEALAVGRCIELKYRADGTALVAMKIDDKPRTDCEDVDTLRGRVDAFPSDLIGTWEIDGTAYSATDETEFKEDKGPFAVDGCVQIQYGMTTLTAVKIESRESDDCLGPVMKVTDLIVARPGDVITGTWTIGLTSAEADLTTNMDGADSNLQPNYCAELTYADDGGTNVALQIKAKDRNDCESIAEQEGLLDSLPVGITGTWTISATDYTVDINTELKQSNGPFAVGACVKVRFGETTLIAVKVETRDGCTVDEPNMHERAYGIVSSIPAGLTGTWTIGPVAYTVDDASVLRSKHGPLAEGICAKVDYLADTLLALKVESAEPYHCGLDGGHDSDDLRIYGTLVSFPPTLIGAWSVDAATYQAGFGTEFKEDKGPFAAGACVEVRYLEDSLIALKIKTADTYHCGAPQAAGGLNQVANVAGSYAQRYGVITQMPADLYGTWTIDGDAFSANATTLFRELYSALEIGACVRAYVQTADNSLLGLESVDPYACQTTTIVPSIAAPVLYVNASSAAPGSTFVYLGHNFAADVPFDIYVDGEWRGAGLTDSLGSLTFALGTLPTPNATYVVHIALNGDVSDLVYVTIDASQPFTEAPAIYTGPTYLLNPVPTAVSTTQLTVATPWIAWAITAFAVGFAALAVILRRRPY